MTVRTGYFVLIGVIAAAVPLVYSSWHGRMALSAAVADHNTPPEPDSSGHTPRGPIGGWDDEAMLQLVLATLDRCVMLPPIVPDILSITESLLTNSLTPTEQYRITNEWRLWSCSHPLGNRVSVYLAEGLYQGQETQRMVVFIKPTAPVPHPFKPNGSMIELMAYTKEHNPELLIVASYGLCLNSMTYGLSDEPDLDALPPVTFGHRFRISDDGAVNVIRYWAQTSYDDNGKRQLNKYYGSEMLECKAEWRVPAGDASRVMHLLARRLDQCPH